MATILLRSRMAQSSASNASAKRIARAVEVKGKGALSEESKRQWFGSGEIFCECARRDGVFSGFRASIVNCDSRDSF